MGFYTKSYLESLSSRNRDSHTFRNTVNEGKRLSTFDIFLSHSYKDKPYILGLYMDLTAKGFTVYVDWIIDPHLQRDNVTKETVNKIRGRMKQSRSLIYATSENASRSKWMPWELGFMDGDKGRCAILPITDHKDDHFRGQEFLSVYPVIKKDHDRYSDSELVVKVDDHTESRMKNWLNI